MQTRTTTPAVTEPSFLARVYQFERNRLTQCFPVAGDGYALPDLWRPDSGVWKKLGSITTTRGINPVQYIRWSMLINQVGYPPNVPEPNRLLEVKRLDLYLAERPKVLRNIELQFDMEKEKARIDLTIRQGYYGESAEFAQIGVVAGGGALGLSPLFCFILARDINTEKLLRIAGRIEADAMFQFSKEPTENAAVYGATGRLPLRFAAKADKFYVNVVDQFAARVGRKGA